MSKCVSPSGFAVPPANLTGAFDPGRGCISPSGLVTSPLEEASLAVAFGSALNELAATGVAAGAGDR